MNRRQRRALAKKIPEYKKLSNEMKLKVFEQVEEMLKKQWQKDAGAADFSQILNKTIEESENKDSKIESKNAGETNGETN